MRIAAEPTDWCPGVTPGQPGSYWGFFPDQSVGGFTATSPLQAEIRLYLGMIRPEDGSTRLIESQLLGAVTSYVSGKPWVTISLSMLSLVALLAHELLHVCGARHLTDPDAAEDDLNLFEDAVYAGLKLRYGL